MKRWRYEQAPLTYGLMALCIIVYIYTTIRFSFSMNAMEGIEAGAFLPLAVLFDHQYYRFLTANLIHFGPYHLAMNMLSLNNIAPFIEQIFGKQRYALLLLGSALSTTGLPYLYYRVFLNVDHQMALTVSGGASGIILGLVGGLCYLSWRYRGLYQRVFQSVLPSLIIVLIISITMPSISLSGHIGGFIGGLITTFFIDRLYPNASWYPTNTYYN